MAQKRMIDKKISVSETVSDLPLESQLLFTWCIPHSDDIGLLPISLKTLKALIVPMQDWTLEQFSSYWGKIVNAGLIVEFQHEGNKFWRVSKFFSFQKLRKDVQPFTILQIELPKNLKESWEILYKIAETNGIRIETETNDDVTGTEQVRNGLVPVPSTEEKRSKEKRSKENIYGHFSFDTFWNLYPHKVNKKGAIKSWNKIKFTDELYQKIISSLKGHCESEQWQKNDGEFIPHPTTWLNQERWESILPKVKPKEKKPFYQGDPVVEKNGKRYVIVKGQWLEYAGKQSEIEWK